MRLLSVSEAQLCGEICQHFRDLDLLLCLMAYQVTGEERHEWTGITMTLTVIVHQILNRRWYAVLFKGKYHAYRSLTTLVNLLLIGAIAVTALCGMSMSEYAVPFLYWTGEGLSVHYSGGSGLPDSVSAWLEQNDIRK